MTFGELRFDVSKFAPGLDPDLLDSFINDRYQRILDHHKWKDLEVDGTLTTAVNTRTYAVPADFNLPLEGRNPTTDDEIVFISRAELNLLAPSRSATGAPQVYTLVDAVTFEVYPVPTAIASYTQRYIKRVARFTSTDTAVVIPPWISMECLKAGVKADICETQKDYAGADRKETKFMRELTTMAVTDASRMGPVRVRISRKFSPAAFVGRSDHRRQMP